MSEMAYSFRLSLLSAERAYTLTDDTLAWREGELTGSLPFSQIKKIRLWTQPSVYILSGGTIPGFQRCEISGLRGRPKILSSNHYLRLGNFEDRSITFTPFVAALIERVEAANPTTVFVRGLPILVLTLWVVCLLLGVIFTCFVLAMFVVAVRASDIWMIILTAFALVAAITGALATSLYMVIRHWPRTFNPRSSASTR